MLAPALRRHRGNSAFHDLQKCLLHALARYVSRNGRIVGLTGNLVDFVNIDDATLRPLDIVIGSLQQFQNDVFDILANVTGFCQRRSIGHGKRHIQHPREGLCQQGLAAPCWADKQDVGF